MKEIRVKKIILEQFIDMLVEAYESGADYIDLVAQDGNGQDRLGVLIHTSYMNLERHNKYIARKPKKEIPLTKIDLTRLINNSIN